MNKNKQYHPTHSAWSLTAFSILVLVRTSGPIIWVGEVMFCTMSFTASSGTSPSSFLRLDGPGLASSSADLFSAGNDNHGVNFVIWNHKRNNVIPKQC